MELDIKYKKYAVYTLLLILAKHLLKKYYLYNNALYL